MFKKAKLKIIVLFPAIFYSAVIFSSEHPLQTEQSPMEILVVGEQPGPELWKVSKDDHVLWVFGTFSPLPKNVKWRSKKLEDILAHSKELLMPPGFQLQASFFGALSMLPLLPGIENNPDGKKLQDVMSPELYTRWEQLKEKHLPKDNSVENKRPIFAAKKLLNKAIEDAGLTSSDLNGIIESLAKKNKVKITTTQVSEKLEQPRQAAKNFRNSPMADNDCFAKTLARIESEVGAIKIRANSWAVGDLDSASQLSYAEEKSTCMQAIMTSSINQDNKIQKLEIQAQEKWIDAAEKALTNNASTVAVMTIADILKPDSYLTKLQLKGYLIEGYGYNK